MLTQNKTLIKDCKPALSELFHNDLESFIALFFWEKEISGTTNRKTYEVLQKAGILTENNGNYYANVMVYPLRDKFIVTDFVFSVRHKKVINSGQGTKEMFVRKRDQVWAMLPHETPQIIKQLDVHDGDIVLDLATGSGAIALFCADKAKKVYATDINPRAIEYAKFNSILNNLEDKIECRLGNLFDPVNGLKFDYIVWNGPTVAAPLVSHPENTYALTDFGGADGADFTRRFLDNVTNFINKNARLMWYDSCLGNKNRSVSTDYIIQKFCNSNYKVEIDFLNKGRGIPLSILQKLFQKYRTNRYPLAFDNFVEVDVAEVEWRRWIKEKKLNYVHFAIVKLLQNTTNNFEIVERLPSKNIITPNFIIKEWHFMSERQILKVFSEEGTL